MVNPLRNLADRSGLLFHRLYHDGHLGRDAAGADAGAVQGPGYLVHHMTALGHGGDGAFNQVLGGLGGFVGLVGQVADLVGNHGKALSGRSGPGRLHGGVQGQDVRLEGNVFDGGNDFADFLGGAGDLAHRHVELLDVFHADAQLAPRLFHKLTGLLRGLGGPLGVSGDVADGGGELLDGAGLLRCALGQSLGGIGHLLGPGGYLFGAFPDLAHGFTQLGLDAVQGDLDGHKVSHVFLPGGGGQVPGGNGVQYGGNLADVGAEPLDCSIKNKS